MDRRANGNSGRERGFIGCGGMTWTLVTTLLGTVAVEGAAAGARPAHADVVQSRQFDIHYKAGASSVALTSVDCWYTVDQGKTWHLHGRDADRVSPFVFLADGEGLYGFYIVLRNRYGASSPAPTSGVKPQRWVLVDFTPPVVQFQDARPDPSFATTRRVLLRWSAYDAHLPPRPVWLYYRTEGQANWAPMVDRLTNRGRFDWEVPDAVTGKVWVKLTVRDRVGHEAEQTRGPLTIEARKPVKPATTTAPSARSGASVGASRPPAPVVTEAAAEEAVARFELGTFHRLRGELDVAVERFGEALRFDPTHLAAGNDLGGVLHLMGDYDKAIGAYVNVLKQDPKHQNALKGLALAYVAQRNYGEAHERLADLLRLDPGKGDTWLHLGDVAMLRGNTLDARGYWSKALTVEPKARDTVDKASARLASLVTQVGVDASPTREMMPSPHAAVARK